MYTTSAKLYGYTRKLPFEKKTVLHMLVTQECMVLRLVTLDIMVLEKKDSSKILFMHFHYDTITTPRERGRGFHLNKLIL